MVRLYARYVGIILVVVGVLGLVLSPVIGEGTLFGLINIDLLENLIHIVTGAIFAYVGYAVSDVGTVQMVVGVLGILYLLLGLLGFYSPDLFEVLPEEYSVVDNLIHLVVGVLSIALAWFVGRQATATA